MKTKKTTQPTVPTAPSAPISPTVCTSARQAIVTRFIPATNLRPYRIRAFCDRGAVVVSYPEDLDVLDAHRLALGTLLARFAAQDGCTRSFGTVGDYFAGALPNGVSGSFAWVTLPKT